MKINKTTLFTIFIGLYCITAHAANSLLQPMSFPATAADTTFVERRNSATTGYAPYANRSAYQTLAIESQEEYISRMVNTAETQRQKDIKTLTNKQYCDLYPLDAEHCPQTPNLESEIIATGNRPTPKPTEQPPQPTTPITPLTPAPTAPIIGYSEFGHPVTADVTIHNGPCTMPQASKHFPNKILTSGHYAAQDPAFEKAMITTFRTEGGCGQHPDDSGGYTCYGVSQNNNPEIDVRNITRRDAEDIAYNKYYTQYGLEKLPDNIRGNVFMLGWAGGTITGIHRFCKFLGLSPRNKIDDEIVTAAENYNGDLHNDFMDEQQRFFIEVSKRGNNRVFLKGWMNRVALGRENGCHTPTTEPIYR